MPVPPKSKKRTKRTRLSTVHEAEESTMLEDSTVME